MKIPIIILKDKQVFSKKSGYLSHIGKPLDIAKKLSDSGYKLIHIVDENALKGFSTNMDIYDKLTYFINIEVECAPKEDLVRKLTSVRARAVVVPEIDTAGLEKKLLVAKLEGDIEYDLDGFNDLFLASEAAEKKYEKSKKRKITFSEGNWGTTFFF